MSFYTNGKEDASQLVITRLKDRVKQLEKENAELKLRLSSIHEMVATVALIPRQLMEFKGYIEELRARDAVAASTTTWSSPEPNISPAAPPPPPPPPPPPQDHRPAPSLKTVNDVNGSEKVQLWDGMVIEKRLYIILKSKRNMLREFTNTLLRAMHSHKTLASCSLTGKVSNAHPLSRPKRKLPHVEQTIEFIHDQTGASLKSVKMAISTLLSTETRSRRLPYHSTAEGRRHSEQKLTPKLFGQEVSSASNRASVTTIVDVHNSEQMHGH